MKLLTLLCAILFTLSLAFAPPPPDPDKVFPEESATTIAYYFYNTVRCSNCLKIENYSHQSIDENFSEELASGDLVWQMKNLDEEENEHFIEDYQLYTKSLILARFVNGQQTKWKNCEKVWEYLGDEAAFKNYVKTEVAAFIRN